jgi:hypothetical protein
VEIKTCLIFDENETGGRVFRPGLQVGKDFYAYTLSMKDRTLMTAVSVELTEQLNAVIIGWLNSHGFYHLPEPPDRIIPL